MPKIVDKDEMRNNIMDAAMVVYAKVGFHVATMEAVAKQAGLGKGTVYLYFKSKEALTLSIVDRIFSGMEQSFISSQLSSNADEFRSQLRNTMDISQDHASFVRVFFEVFGPSFASKDFVERVAGFFDRLGQHYAQQIEHLQDIGEFRPDIEPETTGRAIAAMIDGIILHRGLFSMPVKRHRELIDSSLNLLLTNCPEL